MILLVLAFSFGLYAAFQLTELPSVYWCLLLPVFLFSFVMRFAWLKWFSLFGFTFLYVVAYAYLIQPVELDRKLQKKDLTLIGTIADLPEKKDKATRFLFDVDSIYYQGHRVKGPERIRLSWYQLYEPVRVGERWQLVVRLKRPHGFSNPGSFDYERWLFERGIGATGYVRKNEKNVRLETAPLRFAQLRENLRNKIQTILNDSPMSGFIQALVIGERADLTDEHWRILNATGTNHLMAISGLHIGLVAGFVFFMMKFIWRRSEFLCLRLPAQKAAAMVAILAAIFYAALAGFALPTQRAMIMFGIVMLALFSGLRWRPTQILIFAYIAVLLFDPFAFLSAGFWLSFLAVAAIFYAMQGRQGMTGLWWTWGRMQWVITLLLIPVLLLFFQRLSLISPLANLIAVPWMSFVVVPLALFGSVLSFFDGLGGFFLNLASESMNLLWILLQWLADLPSASIDTHTPVLWTIPLALFGLVWLLLPRGIPFRWIGIIWLLPLVFLRPGPLLYGDARLTVLDVGQGLAAVVQTKDGVMVYDTGPEFSRDFDAGEAILLPFLRHIGVDKIDTLVLSHGDSDHAGGLRSLLGGIEVRQFVNGATEKIKQPSGSPCVAGDSWQSAGVSFELIFPDEKHADLVDNNGSCVVRVKAKNNILLLTGDIEKKAERFLIKSLGSKLDADVMLIPHHGSKTSSIEEFIDNVSPQVAINAVGFNNRYRLPNEKVMQRYADRGIEVWDTAQSGAISLTLTSHGVGKPVSYRQTSRRFWHTVN